MNVEDVEELEPIRNNDPEKTHVNLELNDENTEIIAEFAEAIQGNTHLNSMSLDAEEGVGEENVTPLLPFLSGDHGRLRDLQWGGNETVRIPNAIMQAVAVNPFIQKLVLSRATISVEALSTLLRSTNTINKFGSASIELDEEDADVSLLAEAFQNNSSVQELAFSAMKERYLNLILRQLSTSTVSVLEQLGVQNHDYQCSVETAQAIKEVLLSQSLTRFKTMYLHGTRFTGETFGPIAHGLQHSAHATVFTVESCTFDARATRLFSDSFQRSMGNFNTLEVFGNEIQFSEPLSEVLARCMGPTSCLKNLFFEDISFSGLDFVDLGNGLQCTPIRSLSLVNCFRASNIDYLASIFGACGTSGTLESFEMQDDELLRLSPRFIKALTDTFLTRNQSLRKLKLKLRLTDDDFVQNMALSIRDKTSISELDLSGSDITPAGMSLLLNGLRGSTAIEKLFLCGIDRSLDDANLPSVVSFIKSNTCCATLGIDGNRFSGNSYPAILAALQTNKVLEELYMTCHMEMEVSDDAKLEFLSGAAKQDRLKCLRLRQLSPGSGTRDEEILKLYRENFSLEDCSIKPTNPNYRSEVDAILHLNKAGRRYLKEDGKPRAKGAAVLANVADDLDCLFVHLKENPSLCDIRTVQSPTRAYSANHNIRKRKRNDEEALPPKAYHWPCP